MVAVSLKKCLYYLNIHDVVAEIRYSRFVQGSRVCLIEVRHLDDNFATCRLDDGVYIVFELWYRA